MVLLNPDIPCPADGGDLPFDCFRPEQVYEERDDSQNDRNQPGGALFFGSFGMRLGSELRGFLFFALIELVEVVAVSILPAGAARAADLQAVVVQ